MRTHRRSWYFHATFRLSALKIPLNEDITTSLYMSKSPQLILKPLPTARKPSSSSAFILPSSLTMPPTNDPTASPNSPTSPRSSSSSDIPVCPTSEQAPLPETILMTRSQAWNLYTTHFLSTWNVRTYEFAAVSGPDAVMTKMLMSVEDYFHRCGVSGYFNCCCCPVRSFPLF